MRMGENVVEKIEKTQLIWFRDSKRGNGYHHKNGKTSKKLKRKDVEER